MRRLPVYLLLDVSDSMQGEPIQAVQNGIENLATELRRDPYALETAWVSIVSFGTNARVESKLTELALFQYPILQVGGSTSLGKGLKLLSDQIAKEVRKSSPTKKGDWKPLVFIMSDGNPTDNWEYGADYFKKQKPGTIVACAAGNEACISVLQAITPNVLKLNTADEKSIRDFFKWVSSSVKLTSTKVENTTEPKNTMSDLPPPPPGIDLVKH